MAYNSQQPPYGYGSTYSGGPPPPNFGQGFPQGGFPQGPGYPQGQGFPPGQGYPYPQGQPGFNAPYGMGMPTAGFHMPTDGVMNKPPSEAGAEGMEFSEQSIRKAFIRKVYSILMIQLLVTFGFVALFVYHRPLRDWTVANPGVFYGAMGITIVTMIALACCESVRRKSPLNIICLAIFTLAEGFLLGTASSAFNAESVVLAVGITAAICLALTIFSFQTKIDFTAIGGILFVCVIILFIMGILSIFFAVLKVIYAGLGALLFSVYLIYDTQLMMGGNHKYSISPEEYIFAALNLYLDIVNIFIFILSLLGSQD